MPKRDLENTLTYPDYFLMNVQLQNSKSKDTELFRLAFENANIGMCLVDLSGNIFKVNEEMVNIFGYSIKELQTMNVNDIAHPDFKEVSSEFIKNASEGSKKHSMFEKAYIHKNGSTLTCNVTTSSVFDENQNLVFFISHVQDITDKKNAERILLERKEELQRLNAEKDKFFSIIAHDLINPFSSIVGFSDLLIEEVHEKRYDIIEKYSEIIQASSQRAISLLMNLMVWSRSQSGRMDYQPLYFEMADILKEVVLLFSDSAKQKAITVITETPSQARVFADRNMINTVLRNLISNAIKFTKNGGAINITVTDNQDKIAVSVCDNGIGLTKERMEQLFHLDTNSSTPGTENEEGTGLGLILCKEFIQKHDGKIWVESEIGKGSCFKFIIPTNKSATITTKNEDNYA
jgi:PAS domain S-box-containing protein